MLQNQLFITSLQQTEIREKRTLRTKLKLPSQILPLNPSLHEHSNPSSVSVHIPPFLHGLGWHLFSSTKQTTT